MSFKELGLTEGSIEYFKERKFKQPTQVQSKVIPSMMSGKSVLVISQTGSGKTLSYGLPTFELLKKVEAEQGQAYDSGSPRALILAPTRELALQIFEQLKGISHHHKLKIRQLTGGFSSAKTAMLSRQIYDILIATPARVVSGMKNKELNLKDLRLLVLDEADQLLEMGFEKDIDNIRNSIQGDYQLGLFSATLPAVIEEYITEKLSKHELEKVSFSDSHQLQKTIETFNLFVAEKQKPHTLLDFLSKKVEGRGILFVNRKQDVDEWYEKIEKHLPQLRITKLHGDLSSHDRARALRAFKEKKIQILLTTDIAARGMDFEDLDWIVNISLPRTAVYYLHRCGRVGRMGKRGVVYNLVGEYDQMMIARINDSIKKQSHLKMNVLPTKTVPVAKKVVKKTEVKKPAPTTTKKPAYLTKKKTVYKKRV